MAGSTTTTPLDEALSFAGELGAEHGENAADWWLQDVIGGRASGDTRETARRILKGLGEVSPKLLDTLPSPDLSGQWTDGLSGPALYRQAWQSVEQEPPEDLEEGGFHEVCDAYRFAFADAVEAEVRKACRAEIEPEPEGGQNAVRP